MESAQENFLLTNILTIIKAELLKKVCISLFKSNLIMSVYKINYAYTLNENGSNNIKIIAITRAI